MFHVINVATGKPLEREPGSPHEYATGQEAAQAAQAATASTGAKHQPRRVVIEVDWRARERQRMSDGTYIAMPECWATQYWWRLYVTEGTRSWQYIYDENECPVLDDHGCHREELFEHKPKFADHFPHPSTAKDGMIAFTEDDDKGRQDRQTRLTPGRYLTRYFSDVLSTSDIAKLAALYRAHFEDIELKVTQDADEVERVYVNGPTSCMSKDATHYDGSEHPARVYAGPDLGVAYIETDACGITARAVVWPKRMRYGRVYGDETRLARLLQAAGYASGSLSGARVQLIEDENDCDYLVMPFVDYVDGAEIDGRYVRLGGGSISTGNTNGRVARNEYSWHCEHCDEGFTDDDCSNEVYTSRRNSEYWCDHCVSSDAFHCDGTDRHYSDHSVSSYSVRDETWCEYYFEEHGATCEATGDACAIDDTVTLEDGTIWSRDYFEEHGHQCDKCSCLFAKDDITCECATESEESESEEESEDGYKRTFSSIGHIARQGRDESPMQCEMTLAPAVPPIMLHGHPVNVGDSVYVRYHYSLPQLAEGFYTVDALDHSDTSLPVRVACPGLGYSLWPVLNCVRLARDEAAHIAA